MPSPAFHHLTETRGDTWSLVVNITDETTGSPVNITGRTYALQVRSSTESSTVKAAYTCTVTNAANGQVTCTCPSSTTKNVKIGEYVWDFEQTISGSPSTIISGTLTCLGDVTR